MKASAPYRAGSFVSNLVSKIIAFFCCTNQKNSHCRAYFFDAKKPQTRTNTRKDPQPQGLRVFHLYGGAEGSRTPVRKLSYLTFYKISEFLDFISK